VSLVFRRNAAFARVSSSSQPGSPRVYECVVPEGGEVRSCMNPQVPSLMWPAGTWPMSRVGSPQPTSTAMNFRRDHQVGGGGGLAAQRRGHPARRSYVTPTLGHIPSHGQARGRKNPLPRLRRLTTPRLGGAESLKWLVQGWLSQSLRGWLSQSRGGWLSSQTPQGSGPSRLESRGGWPARGRAAAAGSPGSGLGCRPGLWRRAGS